MVDKKIVRYGVFSACGKGYVPDSTDPAKCFAYITWQATCEYAERVDGLANGMAHSKIVPLYAAPGLDQEDIECTLRSRPMATWFALAAPTFEVEYITVTGVDHRNDKQRTPDGVMFVHLKVKYAEWLFEKVVDLANDSAVILVVLYCNSVPYTVLVRQDRDAIGQKGFPEVPAGRIEKGGVKSAALAEIEQELGLQVQADEIRLLTEVGDEIAVSPGAYSERQAFFYVNNAVSEEELAAMQGKKTGLAEEGESLTCQVIRLSELPVVARRDAKSIVAWALYDRLLPE